MLKSPHPTVNLQCQKNTALRVNPWAKLLVVWGLVAIGNILYVLPLLAAPPAAGTTIDNKATGTFVDGDDLTNLEQSVESNTVTITVAKVAGITVGAQAPAEAPSTVNGAGPYQNFSGIQTGDVVYFDFIITNTGNDVTQFTIPSTATVTGGGTVGTLQIIGYNNLVFDGLSGNPNPINIPTSFDPIANSTGKLLATTVGANRGSVAVGGTIKVRVPVTISASAGSNVTVLLGNTDEVSTSTQTPKERLQNQAYIDNSSTDVYTLYSTDTGGGNSESADPPANGSREASAIALATVLGKDVSGNVFDDVNYGGGVGRSKGVSGGQGVNGATVELYDSTGKFVRSIITDNLGDYTFPGVPIGDFFVRVVNNTVVSSRSATGTGLVPVQTFRTNAATGTITTVTNRVGGEKPAEVDAPANTTATLAALNLVNNQEVQSLTAVKVGSTALTGIDFGYNFDTIVNTNDAGQGSLRQFVTNSNALSNTGLVQVGQTPGKEVSIFMIPGQAGLSVGDVTTTATPGIRAGVPTQLTNGVAIIMPTTALPQITDANTSIDGSTQTNNVSDTNTGTLGYAGSVGTGANGVSGTGDETVLTAINKPEVEIQGISGNVLDIKGENVIVRGVAIRGTNGSNRPIGIQVQPGANSFLVENSIIGSGASTFADPAASNRLTEAIISLGTTSNVIIRNNLVGYVGSFGIRSNNPGLLVERNRFAEVGRESWLANSRAEQMRFYGNGPATIKDNYFDSTVVGQIDLGGAQNVTVDNNTLTNGHSVNTNDSYENGAIHARGGASQITISHNIISNTQNNAHGIMMQNNSHNNSPIAASRIKITKNSIFNSGKLGINLNPTGQLPTVTNDGVTPNDGLLDPTAGNNGMDYPILISSSLRVNAGISTLSVTGYVGNLPAGSTTFDRAVIEFFVGATDTNDRGKVFSTDPDTVSKLHAEGQTYLGSCNTDANGLFGNVGNPCTLNVPTGTEPLKITSTATDLAGNTSEFSAAIASNPNLLLVKRITAINGGKTTNGGQDLAIYNPTNSPYDDNVDDTPPFVGQADPNRDDTTYWPSPSSFLLGGTDGGMIKPNDSIEYTIYFLSTGDTAANNVLICDRVPQNVTFIPSAFSSGTHDSSGLSTADRGIAINLSGTLKSYTNIADGDFARYYPPLEPLPNGCKAKITDPPLPNPNGTVVVSLSNIPNATTAGEAGSYGFIRFQGQVK